MPGKSKSDYLNMSFAAGENKAKTILQDAVANKAVNTKLKCIKYLSNGDTEICITKGASEYTGVGVDKAEAVADAAGQV
jgi:hypothetical protein